MLIYHYEVSWYCLRCQHHVRHIPYTMRCQCGGALTLALREELVEAQPVASQRMPIQRVEVPSAFYQAFEEGL